MSRLIYILMIITSFGTLAWSQNMSPLQCKQVSQVLQYTSFGELHAFCDDAEFRCKALGFLQLRPKDDPLRQDLEAKLEAQTRYELDVCEVAIRHYIPDFDPSSTLSEIP